MSFSREVRIWAWEKIKESMKIYLLAVMTGRIMAARPMERGPWWASIIEEEDFVTLQVESH